MGARSAGRRSRGGRSAESSPRRRSAQPGGLDGIVGRLPRGSACGGEGLTEKELAREGALPMSAIDGLARSEEVSRLVTPEILLPVQLGGHETYRGEKRLML